MKIKSNQSIFLLFFLTHFSCGKSEDIQTFHSSAFNKQSTNQTMNLDRSDIKKVKCIDFHPMNSSLPIPFTDSSDVRYMSYHKNKLLLSDTKGNFYGYQYNQDAKGFHIWDLLETDLKKEVQNDQAFQIFTSNDSFWKIEDNSIVHQNIINPIDKEILKLNIHISYAIINKNQIISVLSDLLCLADTSYENMTCIQFSDDFLIAKEFAMPKSSQPLFLGAEKSNNNNYYEHFIVAYPEKYFDLYITDDVITGNEIKIRNLKNSPTIVLETYDHIFSQPFIPILIVGKGVIQLNESVLEQIHQQEFLNH